MKSNFEKYVEKNVAQLFPDADDVAGKRIIFKCDGGPGRKNVKLLAKLRAQRIYLYLFVVNITAVSQETDQLFVLFKTTFCNNLDKLSSQKQVESPLEEEPVDYWNCYSATFPREDKTGIAGAPVKIHKV